MGGGQFRSRGAGLKTCRFSLQAWYPGLDSRSAHQSLSATARIHSGQTPASSACRTSHCRNFVCGPGRRPRLVSIVSRRILCRNQFATAETVGRKNSAGLRARRHARPAARTAGFQGQGGIAAFLRDLVRTMRRRINVAADTRSANARRAARHCRDRRC